MQYLVLTRRRIDQFPPSAWTPELAEAESQQVRTMFAAGWIRNIWRRHDIPGAALLFEATCDAEVRDHMSTLPLVKLGMLEIILVTGLEPYPGFGPR